MSPSAQNELAELLSGNFEREEIRDLVERLDVDFGEIDTPGTTCRKLARDVVTYFGNRGTEGDVVAAMWRGRPRVAALKQFVAKHYPDLLPAPGSAPVNGAAGGGGSGSAGFARRLTATELKEVCALLANAFDFDSLNLLVLFHLDFRLEDEVGPGPFGRVVFDLVNYTQQRGITRRLLQAAIEERAERPDLVSEFTRILGHG